MIEVRTVSMSGHEYLENIRNELHRGRHQHRMGENLLRAFGYMRRRATAINEINETLKHLGPVADPPINSEMPLRAPRIRFSIETQDQTMSIETGISTETTDYFGHSPPMEDEEELRNILTEPAFSVSELKSANTDVVCISASESIKTAYTIMSLRKYSQLVVADRQQPQQQTIKGIISFQSMTKALMNGSPKTVGDCLDSEVCFAQSHDDLRSVVGQLSGNDVVLVIGEDKRLQGIVTAWDLAEEFAQLVDPFKRIGEIEERLRALVRVRLGKDKVGEFLREHGLSGVDPIAEIDELSMGELQWVLDYPEHWEQLELAFARNIFIEALNEARDFRNRLMHFRDPLTELEVRRLSSFCDTVREIRV